MGALGEVVLARGSAEAAAECTADSSQNSLLLFLIWFYQFKLKKDNVAKSPLHRARKVRLAE